MTQSVNKLCKLANLLHPGFQGVKWARDQPMPGPFPAPPPGQGKGPGNEVVNCRYIHPGAIIRDGDCKRAPFLVLGLAPWYGKNFSIFRTNCAIGCGTRAYIAARIFADVAQGKWRPKFPKSFMLWAHNSTPLWLLEFCLSIFAVSCSSLSEDSAEFRYVPLYIADQVEFRCSFSVQELHITPI